MKSIGRSAVLVHAVLLAAAILCSSTFVPAQEKTAAPQWDQRRADTERDLAVIRQQISLGENRRGQLSGEIGKLEKDRASINKALIETAARARQVQQAINQSEKRLDQLNGEQDQVRVSLKGRRAVLSEVLGALLKMGANPPPAIIVTPEDALLSVRSAILLGAVVPEVRAETDILVIELNELVRIGKEIGAERGKLLADLNQQAEDEQRLTLLVDEKKKLTASARQELANQGVLAAELAGRETDLSRLIDKMETEIAAVRGATQSARNADAERKANEQRELAGARTETARRDYSDTARIAPAMAFEKAAGLLPRPVEGVEIHAFGQSDTLGEPSPGLSIATIVNARVVSPTDGWVVYAGPFRTYGQLLIVNAGDGYHIVLAGMERIDVQLGQFVLAGEPVAAMGARRIASVEAIGVESVRPVLYVEFRNNGKSIDPSPWWAEPSAKRVADDS